MSWSRVRIGYAASPVVQCGLISYLAHSSEDLFKCSSGTQALYLQALMAQRVPNMRFHNNKPTTPQGTKKLTPHKQWMDLQRRLLNLYMYICAPFHRHQCALIEHSV
jgi:hypothetical protein